MNRWTTGQRTGGRRTSGRRTSIEIPLPAVGPVGVGLLGCRTSEWGQERGVELLLHRTTGNKITGCWTTKRRTNE